MAIFNNPGRRFYLRKMLRELDFQECEGFPKLVKMINKVHSLRYEAKNTRKAQTVTRTSSLYALGEFNEQVRLVLENAGLDWNTFGKTIGLNTSPSSLVQEEDAERSLDVCMSLGLFRSLKLYRKQFLDRTVLDAPSLAYGIIDLTAIEPNTGTISHKLHKSSKVAGKPINLEKVKLELEKIIYKPNIQEIKEDQTTKLAKMIRWFQNHRLFSVVLLLIVAFIGIGYIADAFKKIRSIFPATVNTSSQTKAHWVTQQAQLNEVVPGNIVHTVDSRLLIERDVVIDRYEKLDFLDDEKLEKLRNSIIERLRSLPIITEPGYAKIDAELPSILHEDMRLLWFRIKTYAETEN